MWSLITSFVPSLLSSSKNYIYIALIAIVAVAGGGGYFYIKYLQNERDTLQTQLNVVLSTYEQNVKEFEKAKHDYSLTLESLKRLHAEQIKKNTKIITIKEEVRNVKKEDDAPTAPVLSSTINRLFE